MPAAAAPMLLCGFFLHHGMAQHCNIMHASNIIEMWNSLPFTTRLSNMNSYEEKREECCPILTLSSCTIVKCLMVLFNSSEKQKSRNQAYTMMMADAISSQNSKLARFGIKYFVIAVTIDF